MTADAGRRGPPWWPALLWALAGVAVCVLAPAPRTDNRPTAWLAADHPASQAYADFTARFGGDEVLVIRLHAADPVDRARAVTAWQARLLEGGDFARVLSARSLDEDALDALLDPALATPEARPGLEARFEGPLGKTLDLWSAERGTATLYALGDVRPPETRVALATAVEAARERARTTGEGGVTALEAAGNPLLNVALDAAGRAMDTTTLPALVGVCVLVLLGLTRSVRLTAIALVPLGLAVLTTDRLLDLAQRPHNLVVGIVRPLLFVLLLASAVHLLTAWQAARRNGLDAAEAATKARAHTGRAVALALFTTALGFGSLGLSTLSPIRDFGLSAAAGLAFGGALLLTALPWLLARLGPRSLGPAREAGTARLAMAAVSAGLRHPWLGPAVALAALVAGGLAWGHLRQDHHAIRYFATDNPLRHDHDVLAASGVGLASMHVLVEAPSAVAEGRLRESAVSAVDALTRDLAALPGVKAALSPSLLLREAGWQIDGRDGPPSGTALAEALAHERLAPFGAGSTLRITLLAEPLDAPALRKLGAAAAAAVATHLGPEARSHLAGSYQLVIEAQESLLTTLVTSLIGTALLMGLVMVLALRSIPLGLAAMLPNLAPVALNFALMVAVGIPLDVGTAMTAAVALGIAVDDTLHLGLAWRPEDPLAAARTTGGALVGSTLVIGLGFLALLPADFGPTRHFGLLCATAMASALAADLLIWPALLARLSPPRSAPRLPSSPAMAQRD